MAAKNVTPLRSHWPTGSRVDGPLLQRVNRLIAHAGVCAAAAEAISGERDQQTGACLHVMLDSLREELERLAGELETLERELRS